MAKRGQGLTLKSAALAIEFLENYQKSEEELKEEVLALEKASAE